MSQQPTAAPKPAKNRDRWGLRPPRPGIVRGRITNVTRSIDVCDFGELIVLDFELFVGDDQPAVPVRMTGTDFSSALPEGHIVEVPDPDPAIRPIVTTRLDFPPRYENELIAYYPGRDDLPRGVMRMRGLMMVIGPIVFAVVLLGVFLFFFG